MEDSNRNSAARHGRRYVRRVDHGGTSEPGRAPSYVWRLTFRNPNWSADQGPVTKLFDNPKELNRKLETLRSPRPTRPPATIIKIERAQIVGEWEEVDR